MVRMEKAGRFTLYYPTNIQYDASDKEAMSLMKHETTRHILIYLIEKKRRNAKKISEDLNISPSNLSWYLKMLEEKNIIACTKKGRFRFYSVVDKGRIVRCILAQRTTFIDKVVDNFIEAWDPD
jgi:predicted transcriptional regulator